MKLGHGCFRCRAIVIHSLHQYSLPVVIQSLVGELFFESSILVYDTVLIGVMFTVTNHSHSVVLHRSFIRGSASIGR